MIKLDWGMKKINKILLLPVWCFSFIATSVAQQQPSQPTVAISGTVYEKGGARETLIGLHIVGRDPKTKKVYAGCYTVTDKNGKFVINAPLNAELYFTYVSFQPSIYQVKGAASNIVIYMEEEENMMNEVVVIGYQEKSRASVTGSVVKISTGDLTDTPVANAMELLQGRVPGLNIQLNNGLPGAMGQITIRGVSDISVVGNAEDGYDLMSSTPLFVVDGIPQTEVSNYDAQGLISGSGISPLSSIPFEDIDNIQILKDAAATSLYGSEGAYGVILIETKRGNSPVPQVSYSANFAISTPPRLRKVAVGNAERLLRMQQILQYDTSRYQGHNEIMYMPSLADSLNPYWNNNTDWQGQFFRVTYNHSHNLRFSGGNDDFNYKINGNYYTEKGIIKNTDFDRYALGSIVEYRPNNRFRISLDTKLSITANNTGSGNAVSQSGVATGASASSLLPPPSLYSASVKALQVFSVEKATNKTEYSVSANLGYRLPWDINWTGTFHYKYSGEEREQFTPALLSDNNYQTLTDNVSSNSSEIYVRTLMGRSINLYLVQVSLHAGIEYRNSRSIENTVHVTGLPNDYILGPVGHNLSSGTAKVSENKSTFSLIFNPSFNLLTPKFGSKYVFAPSLRPEISSIYGTKTKWLVHPSLGFRWNISEESFMQRFTEISAMSLRLSWGRTVKYNASRYAVWGSYDIDPDNLYNGEMYIPINPDYLPSAHLDPVTNTTWNVGHESSLFNGKLRSTIEVFYKQVDNQLSDVSLPDHSGFNNLRSAETSLVNYGLEVTFDGRPLPRQSAWDLSCNLNFAIIRDVVTKLPNEARQIINLNAGSANRLGMNAVSQLMYVNKGVYAYDEDVPVDPVTGRRLRVGNNSSEDAYFKAGDPVWVDINGDYIIDENDRVIAGNAWPRVTGGFSFNLNYKGFSLRLNTSFVLRRDIVNQVLAAQFDAYTNPLLKTTNSLRINAALAPIESYNFWTPTNRHNATYPNPFDYTHARVIQPFRKNQTLFMEDGSYFKIGSVSMSYRLPGNWMTRLGTRSASLRVSVKNIRTFSTYSGISPESVNGLGYDQSGGYPNRRSWDAGIVIDL
jgi:TonB-linked SusC/RagA family outer membrane protein